MKTLVFKQADNLYRHAADLFAQQAARAIQERGRFVVLLSGGSTPIPLYRLLAQDPWRSRVDWENVIVGWSDERCVPAHHETSNFRAAEQALLTHVPIPETQILRIDGESDPATAAAAYEASLHSVLGDTPAIDLALLGLGVDGHTASLFPAHPALHEDEHWFVSVHVPSMEHPWRVTATFPLLNGSRKVVFLATGTEKQDALARIRKGAFLPAALVRPVAGNTVWLVDNAAFPGAHSK